MEATLLQFINTLDLLLKKEQLELGNATGFSKLTVSQLQYLDAVSALDKPTISEIAEKIRFTKASVTTGVNKLVETGYLIKTQSTHDKREIHVSLSELGETLAQAKRNTLQKYSELINSALDEQESILFTNSLAKIIHKFNLE
ncbi:MAG: MarR family transcriptional regulator [Chloroflexi bacterium HGW-Chloroflexi-5]|jgi:DNA-binding MarR family transcriptional regulator|nr:MAG: MarR family transcriptional regulator [Chloroflexi bacterium HGW-Chloroflexi-5]